MKKYNIFALLMLLIAPLCFIACSENEDTVEEFPDWKNRNEAYFDNVYEKAMGIEDGSWKIIRNYSLEDTIPAGYADHIVVEVLEEGTGSGCPMFTDSVLVHYRGRLLPSTSYSEGYVFDESYEGEFNPQTALPRQLYVGGLIDGFTTALQYMHIGDRWRVLYPLSAGLRINRKHRYSGLQHAGVRYSPRGILSSGSYARPVVCQERQVDNRITLT